MELTIQSCQIDENKIKNYQPPIIACAFAFLKDCPRFQFHKHYYVYPQTSLAYFIVLSKENSIKYNTRAKHFLKVEF